ncbi:hypothetical protein [Actinoplanes awajinensis]|uniref:Uncharacterized protein n=1 Tax=Actinoplanes awajinensis subsp. mycoplanecinus TaxID=135947 RepID=A0A101JBE1_9ACTN|nr:hypothetical protein [Actinoplanes awajinensis]KUL23678.1 hypothetical protein ADL15_45195 [Actinoplanes awajinensis subsp. mycoplanecinus]
MDIGGVVAAAEELLARPFLDGSADSSDWLEGAAQSGSQAHFVPIAVFASLHETTADHDGTAWRLLDEAYQSFEQFRRDVVAALTTRWRPPEPHSFHAEYERVVAGDESVSSLEYDLAMFTSGEPFPAWRHEGRIITLLLGQMDKEFPLVLTVAAVEVATRLLNHDFRQPISYSNLAMRDELVEEPPHETHQLLISGKDAVAVSNGRELLMYCWSVRTALVNVAVWNADPGLRSPVQDFRHTEILRLECPSARLYVESAPDPSQSLPEPLPEGAGTYSVRVARRRQPPDRAESPSQPTDEPHTEEFTIDLWRTGDLPQEWLDLLDDDGLQR